MLSKYCTQYVSKFGKPNSGHRTGKDQSSSQFPRKAVLKNVETTRQLHSYPKLERLCKKPFKLGFSSMWTEIFQMSKLGLVQKAEEPEIKLPTYAGSLKKQESPRKTFISALLAAVLPKTHLTSHSRMSGSGWVTTPSWLSRSSRSFLYSSFLYSFHLFLISSVLLGLYCFCPLLCPSFGWNVPLIFPIFLMSFPFNYFSKAAINLRSEKSLVDCTTTCITWCHHSKSCSPKKGGYT